MLAEQAAVVSRVPSPYANTVLTSGSKWTKNGLFALQVLLVLGGSIVPGGLCALLGPRLFPNNNELGFLPVMGGLGLTALLMWLFVGQLLKNPWSTRYMFHKIRAEFARRPDAIVDSNNSDAIIVEVIPRRNWGQMILDNAEDLGLLFIDSANRQLLFEGDKNRYRVPVDALISSDVELMNKSAEKEENGVPIGLVILKFRDDRIGEREVPFLAMRTVSGDPLGGSYMERAHQLQQRIQNFRGEEKSGLCLARR